MDLRRGPAVGGESPTGWYNYQFETDLRCALGCPPGAHPLYVGKSNDTLRRLLEHAKTQPWFKYVTGWKVFPDVYASERDALAAETQRIHGLLPLANRAQNENNPHRLDFGRPLPRAPHARPASRPVAVAVRREWSPRQRKVAVLAALWLALAVVGWVAAVGSLHASLVHGARDGAVGATVIYGMVFGSRRPRRRRRPAGRSRRRRR